MQLQPYLTNYHMKLRVNNHQEQCPFNIQEVEKKYNATYVGEFNLKGKNGWSDTVGSVFYQTSPKPGHEEYFALFLSYSSSPPSAMITGANSSVATPINAVIAQDGEIIYSRHRHDMFSSKDKSVWVDGGRDYLRTNAPSTRHVSLEVQDGVLQIATPNKPKVVKHNK